MATYQDIDVFHPGDLAVGWHPPPGETAPGFKSLGPETPGIVVRVHWIKLSDGIETQEVWLLHDGQEERWLASELIMIGRGDRADEGSGLENRRGTSHRGFESHPLRHVEDEL